MLTKKGPSRHDVKDVMQLRKEGFSFPQIAQMKGIAVRTATQWVTKEKRRMEAATAFAASMSQSAKVRAAQIVRTSRAKALTLQEIRMRYGVPIKTYNLWEAAYDGGLFGAIKRDNPMKTDTASTITASPYHKADSRQVTPVGDGGHLHNAQAVAYEAEKDQQIAELKVQLRRKEIEIEFIKKKIEIRERLEAEREAMLRR